MKLRKCVVAFALSLGIFCLLRVAFAQAQGQGDVPPLVLTDAQQEYRLEENLELLHDTTGTLTFQEILSPVNENKFVPNDGTIPNLGFSGSTYWIRARVRNESTRQDWLLNLMDARIPYLDMYRVAGDGSLLDTIHTGDYMPFATRQIEHRGFVFLLALPPRSSGTFYLRVESPFAADISALILTPGALAAQERTTYLVYGLFYGAMLIMAGYNLIVFISLRDRTYLYLAIVILGFAASKATQDGLGHQYLWPQIGNNWTSEIAILITMLATSFFTTSFLQLEVRAPTTNLAFNIWRGITTSLLLLVPFFNILPVAVVLLGLEFVLILIAILRAWNSGYRPARLFLATWILPLVATAVYVLYNVGILPSEYFTSNILLAFLAALALLWSLVLADRIHAMRAETQSASASLEHSERQYRSLFQDSRDAVFIVASNGEILDLNPAGLHLFGYARPELAFLNASNLFELPADYKRFQETLDRQGFVVDYEAQMRSKAGGLISTMVTSTRWRDEGRGLSGYQGILRDVTEQRRTQAELATYRLNLEELVAARTTQANAELVERRRAEAELDQRVQELLVLNEIAKTMSTVTDLVPALERVAERMTHLFNISSAVIGEVDTASQSVRILVHFPQSDRRQAEPASIALVRIPLLEQAVAAGEPLQFTGTTAAVELQGLTDLVRFNGIGSVLVVPLRAGGIVNGILIMDSVRADAFDENDGVHLAETIGGTIATAIDNARLYQQAQATAAADERQRLARELHDSVTQLLYSIVLLAGGWSIEARQDKQSPQETEQSFNELASLGQQALGEMRLLLYQLRSPAMSELGLTNALRQRLNAVENRVGIQTQLHVTGDVETLPREVQAELYFITQEALNNSLRHAQATAVEIRVAQVNHHLELLVSDNGTGFEQTDTLGSEGMGLQNMYARAQDIGAQLDIASVPGQGTRIEVRLALEAAPTD